MTAVLSLGSNLGDRAGHLAAGIEIVMSQHRVRAVSPVYETAPVGGPDQPSFLNCVVLVEADDAESLLRTAHLAEEARGRGRAVRWGPRSLDVDVVAVDALESADPHLTLPHPRAHERAFVLVPWHDLDPDAVLPGRGPLWALLRGLDTSGVRRWAA